MDMSEGCKIDAHAFRRVKIDGSQGACLFGCVAYAVGLTAEDVRAAVASHIGNHPRDCVFLGDNAVFEVDELATVVAACSAADYAPQIALHGVWGDVVSLATAASLYRLRVHVLLREQVDRLRHMLSNESLGLFPDYQKRLQVLHKLGHISDDGAVALKGRVASEVNSVDELVATEIVFDPLLSELEPAEIAAVLSALVVQDRTVDSQHLSLTPHLLEACKRIEQLVHALRSELVGMRGADLAGVTATPT